MAHRTRLRQPARERIRVRDLAIELDVHWSEVLRHLSDCGEYVRSELSFVEAPVADDVRTQLGSPDRPQGRAVRVPARRAAVPEFHLEPPVRTGQVENNPFKGVLSAFPFPSGSEPTHASPDPLVAYQSETPRHDPGDYSAAGAFEASDAFRHLEWAARGIAEDEREVWLAAGLSERHGRVAARCHEAGLRPHDLARDVSGFTVLHRVTRGEDPVQVARLLRERADESA